MMRKILNLMGFDVVRYAENHNKDIEELTKFTLQQSDINILNIEHAKGKNIIIYGVNRETSVIVSQLHISIAYYIDDIDERDSDKSIRSVYDLAYEEPGSFFVAVVQPCYSIIKIHKTLTEIGLTENKDYHIIRRLPDYIGIHYRDSALGLSRIYDEKENQFPGFKIFGEEKENDLRIIALGNSTTDPMLNGAMAWPEALYYILKKNGIEIEVFNGGFMDYTSSQELVKMIRDCISLRPDIVISYSGLNDFIYGTTDENSPRYKRPFIDITREQLFNWISQKNAQQVSYGMQSDKSPVEYWVDNQRMMYRIAGVFGIKYIGILQANVYSEGIPSDTINETLKSKCDTAQYNEIYNHYLSLKASYDEADREIGKFPYILNFRHIFDGIAENDMYYDYAHVYEKGNQFIALLIIKHLMKENILPLIKEIKNNK